MIEIDIRGREEIKQFMDAFGDKAMKVIDDELRIIANNLRNDIIKSMRSSPATGRKYKRGGVIHTSSSPGNTPRIDTGNLINRMMVDHGQNYSILYFDNVIYSKFLEEGTKKMKARPFLEPAIERSNWQDHIVNRIIAERFAGRRLEE